MRSVLRFDSQTIAGFLHFKVNILTHKSAHSLMKHSDNPVYLI